MLVIGLSAAALAALVHGYIFVLESLRWTRPSTRRIFGIRNEQDAETMKFLAFNQGFYNLILAVTVILGAVLTVAEVHVVGVTLVLAGTGAMLAAALVLAVAGTRMLRAAVFQGFFPLIAVLTVALAVSDVA